jgi:hypothetical protein
MSKAVYSFGLDSPMKFVLSDSFAETYNNAVEKFLRTQRKFTQKFGTGWDPDKNPIQIPWTNKEKRAWVKFAHIYEKVSKKDGPFNTAMDIYDDYLIRNLSHAVATYSPRFGRVIMLSTAAGAAYVLLRRL